MLEIRNLSKTYKLKKNTIKALDHISLSIQEKGMVFILGKSGSGKSTLLNVIGGLDQFDEGEIIIDGKSSKDFKTRDFDAYRNTYIGFIFQEYNIIDHLSVKDNIALALQLQGKKADQETIDQILKQVDLKDQKNRKPNELSGGQLQRVAIARALIKNPQIIMADEPTGALDSHTGKQVFDTLKQLSKEKLVLIVSHDREFAKQYGDRIIELADGKIISDTSKDYVLPDRISKNINYIKNEFIHIDQCHDLSEDEIKKIIKELKNHQGDAIISLNQGTNQTISKVNHIDDKGRLEVFHETQEKHLHAQNNDRKKLHLIRSRLPLKNSFRFALSNLRLKPFRLIMTIFLSVVSFTLFGLTDTFWQYDQKTATYQSMKDNNINYIAVGKNMVIEDQENDYTYEINTNMNTDDFELLNKQFPQYHFINTFSQDNLGTSLSLSHHMSNLDQLDENSMPLYQTTLSSLSVLDNETIRQNNFKLTGTLPQNDQEIVITQYTAQLFKDFGYQLTDHQGKTTTFQTAKIEDLLNKELTITINNQPKTLKICGILDTHLDLSRYQDMVSENQGIMSYYLQSELWTLLNNSYHNIGYINDALFKQLVDGYCLYATQKNNTYLELYEEDDYYSTEYFYSYDDADQNNIVEFNNNGSVYLNYHTIKNIKLADGSTIEDHILQDVSDIDDTKQMKETIRKTVSQYQNEITSSQIRLSLSDMKYYENIIDQIAGVYINDIQNESHEFVLKDKLISQYNLKKDGYASTFVSSLQDDQSLKDIIAFTYDDGIKSSNYTLNNQVMPMLSTVNSLTSSLKDIFFYMAIGFAFFAAIMFCNFIVTSINNKQHEIGILRAVGARSMDILKIFFNESLVIALINWLLSCLMCYLGVNFFNHYINSEFQVIVTVLDFGMIEILLLLFISLAIAFVSSFLPVYRISRKKPIDAIKDRK